MTSQELMMKLRSGELDCNMSENFFRPLISGWLQDLKSSISIRKLPVPHIIINTGDDMMWNQWRGYDAAVEPVDISNENYIYNIVPRCMVDIGAVDMLPDQLTSPYSVGSFVYEMDNQVYTMYAEFRRLPIKLQATLKYYTDSFSDMMELIQYICTRLAFVRTYNFSYMGQIIQATYRIPDSLDEQHMMEISGDNRDNTNRTLELSMELETYMPVFANRTVHADAIIKDTNINIHPDL